MMTKRLIAPAAMSCLRQLSIAIVAACTLFSSAPALSHEFWMFASPYTTPVGASAKIDLFVGQFFDGELIPLTAQYVTDFQRISAIGTDNLLRRVPRTGPNGITLPMERAGSQLLAIDTHPNFVKLSADQFTYYLADEGLAAIRKLRDASGPPKRINRERYRRHIKALLQVGDVGDPANQAAAAEEIALRKTGQRLEILPLSDPRRAAPTAATGFQVLFEGKPLGGGMIKAWNKHDGQTVLLRAVTDADGMARMTLPFSGVWMLSTVHMLPVANDPALDWESLWSNLTFEIAAPSAPPAVPALAR